MTFFANAAGTLTVGTTINSGVEILSPRRADFDLDGDLDLAVANNGTSNVRRSRCI